MLATLSLLNGVFSSPSVAIICGFFVVVGFFVDRTWSLGIGVSFFFCPHVKEPGHNGHQSLHFQGQDVH